MDKGVILSFAAALGGGVEMPKPATFAEALESPILAGKPGVLPTTTPQVIPNPPTTAEVITRPKEDPVTVVKPKDDGIKRYWIILTDEPGVKGYGRIVNGRAVDIISREKINK